jgi:ABC-type uncharacterized transport system permease subunit
LSAWSPRRPAAGLKARIFARHRAPALEERSFWNLLVPALACLMLSLAVLNPSTFLSPASLRHHLMGDLVLSNLSYSAFASGSAQAPQNHLDSLTFDWTNRSLLASPIGFTSSTN